jgi:hypothetical protein
MPRTGGVCGWGGGRGAGGREWATPGGNRAGPEQLERIYDPGIRKRCGFLPGISGTVALQYLKYTVPGRLKYLNWQNVIQ